MLDVSSTPYTLRVKHAVYAASPVTATVRSGRLLTTLPCASRQQSNVKPGLAVAESVVRCCPANPPKPLVQPASTGEAMVRTVYVPAANSACISVFSRTVKRYVASVDMHAPSTNHPTNVAPALATALTQATSPAAYVPPPVAIP